MDVDQVGGRSSCTANRAQHRGARTKHWRGLCEGWAHASAIELDCGTKAHAPDNYNTHVTSPGTYVPKTGCVALGGTPSSTEKRKGQQRTERREEGHSHAWWSEARWEKAKGALGVWARVGGASRSYPRASVARSPSCTSLCPLLFSLPRTLLRRAFGM